MFRAVSLTVSFAFIFQFCMSSVGQVALTLATLIVLPPDKLPDLFPLVISVFSCGHFLVFTVYFHICQLMSNPGVYSTSSHHVNVSNSTKSTSKAVTNKILAAAKLENTTKNKGKANKLKLRKKKQE